MEGKCYELNVRRLWIPLSNAIRQSGDRGFSRHVVIARNMATNATSRCTRRTVVSGKPSRVDPQPVPGAVVTLALWFASNRRPAAGRIFASRSLPLGGALARARGAFQDLETVQKRSFRDNDLVCSQLLVLHRLPGD
jgi:hypothetical protein